MITLHGIEIKVGDKVWDCSLGWTKVISVDTDMLYPIITTESRFTKEGLLMAGYKAPQLFWQEFEIPAHAFVKPKVMVKKYFVLFERNGGYYTTSDWDDNHYASEEAFKLINIDCSRKFISLILESEIEMEE